jgi:hypothetical protein
LERGKMGLNPREGEGEAGGAEKERIGLVCARVGEQRADKDDINVRFGEREIDVFKDVDCRDRLASTEEIEWKRQGAAQIKEWIALFDIIDE